MLRSFDVSTALCGGYGKDIFSQQLIRICERAKSLYFRVLSAREHIIHKNDSEITAYFEDCSGNAVNMLALFSLFPASGQAASDYIEKRRLVLAENENCLNRAYTLRLSVLTKYSKIFLALPELECIYSCTEILSKSKRLSAVYDDVYNKFTLCT